MMQDTAWMSRTALLVGNEGLEKLMNANVLVVGMGGVGSFAAEFIARAGIGNMTIVDGDIVDPSNRNRQLPALYTTHGQSKAQLMGERLKAINPELNLKVIQSFIQPDMVEELLNEHYDYVVDAIDSVTPKIILLKTAFNKGLKIASSMGAGGKMDPTKIKIDDISKSKICPFAYHIRKVLRKHGISKGFKVAYSTEPADRDSLMLTDGSNFKKSAFGTISYIPAAFGGTLASIVIRDLIGKAV